RAYTLVGGVRVDDRFLARYAREEGTQAMLRLPGTPPSRPRNAIAATLTLPMADLDASPPVVTPAGLHLVMPMDDLQMLVQSVERWFRITMVAAVGVALLLAWWMASRFAGPISQLTQAAATLTLEGSGTPLPVDRDDEIGVLARRLSLMAARLRSAAGRLRVAERRAT